MRDRSGSLKYRCIVVSGSDSVRSSRKCYLRVSSHGVVGRYFFLFQDDVSRGPPLPVCLSDPGCSRSNETQGRVRVRGGGVRREKMGLLKTTLLRKRKEILNGGFVQKALSPNEKKRSSTKKKNSVVPPSRTVTTGVPRRNTSDNSTQNQTNKQNTCKKIHTAINCYFFKEVEIFRLLTTKSGDRCNMYFI